MPPEITAGLNGLNSAAGLMALIGAPPPAATTAAGPPLPEPLNASLFAAFLARNGPPDLLPASKAGTLPVAAGVKQTLPDQLSTKTLNTKTLTAKNAKTMDTLPTLSFPPAAEPKDKASELLLPLAPVHQVLVHQAPAEGTQNAPLASPAAPVPPLIYAAFAPPMLILAGPVLKAPAGTTSTVSASTVSAAGAARTASAAQPVPFAAPMPSATLEPSTLVPPSSAGVLPADMSAPAGLPLPHPWTLTVPASVPVQPQPALPRAPIPTLQAPTLKVPILQARTLQAPVPAVLLPNALVINSKESVPELGRARVLNMTASPAITGALPRIASPVQITSPLPNALQAAVPAQAAPLSQLPQIAAVVPAMPAAGTMQPAVQSSLLPVAGVLSPPTQPGSAKTAGKPLAAALKPAAENADTSTRTPQTQAQIVTPKTAVPAAAPELLLTPEKHAPEQNAPLVAGDGSSSAPFTLPAATSDSAPTAAGKPLSAAEQAEVVRQTAGGVGAMPLPEHPGAVQQMSVQLHPKDWGQLQVSVTIGPSQETGAAKTVTAHIVAETPQVKAALQSGTGALHQALRASGLHLEHVTISIKPPETKALDAKTPMQSASAGQPASAGQSNSFGQPNADTNGSGTNGFSTNGFSTNGFSTNGFGAGGSQSHRQGQPPQALMPSMTDAEPDDAPVASLPLRLAAGRIDTHA